MQFGDEASRALFTFGGGGSGGLSQRTRELIRLGMEGVQHTLCTENNLSLYRHCLQRPPTGPTGANGKKDEGGGDTLQLTMLELYLFSFVSHAITVRGDEANRSTDGGGSGSGSGSDGGGGGGGGAGGGGGGGDDRNGGGSIHDLPLGGGSLGGGGSGGGLGGGGGSGRSRRPRHGLIGEDPWAGFDGSGMLGGLQSEIEGAMKGGAVDKMMHNSPYHTLLSDYVEHKVSLQYSLSPSPSFSASSLSSPSSPLSSPLLSP